MALSLTVYPNLSPRIIKVLVPTTNVTVQEIVNAVRAWEDSEIGELYPELIDAAGKEALGGGVSVGITATLQNAQLMFEGRTEALDDGSGRTCDLTDPLGETLYVDDADFVSAGIYRGCIVVNDTTQEMAPILEVVDLHTIKSFPLSGNGGLGWTEDDNYSIYPEVQCNITGGNLVAIDENGDELPPVFQSPNVQVVRSSSSSATLQELEAIQYSSYNNGVTIDVNSGYSGTSYPVGTPQQPVNNLTDAKVIATSRGFDTLYFVSNFTFPLGTYLTNYKLVGQGLQKTIFTFVSGSIVAYCEAYNAYLTGRMTGIIGMHNCRIGDFGSIGLAPSSQDIVVQECLITGPISLPSNYSGNLKVLNCWSDPDVGSIMTLNMGNSTANVNIRNYSGKVKIVNNISGNNFVLDLNTGGVLLDPTVTAGNFIIRGIGTFENNSTSITSLDITALLNQEQITKTRWDAVYIDVDDGGSGTAFPLGTSGYPVDNIIDAHTIATRNNIEEFRFVGNLILDAAYSNYRFIGTGSLFENNINLNNQPLDTIYFEHCVITGTQNGSSVEYKNAYLDSIVNLSGDAEHCQIAGLNQIKPNGRFSAIEMVIEGDFCFFDLQNSAAVVSIDMNSGWGQFINAAAGSLIELNVKGGEVSLHSSCTGGTYYLEGVGTLFNDSAMVVSDNHFVFDDLVSYHQVEGSIGQLLSTTGDDLKRAVGLMHENIYIDTPVYDENNNLVSARVRIYSVNTSVGTDNDIIGTYLIVSNGDGVGKFTTWSQMSI